MTLVARLAEDQPGVTRYVCKTCGRVFMFPSALVAHILEQRKAEAS